MPYVPDLDLVLTPGYSVARDRIAYAVELAELGQVLLPTGQVVCDPLVPHTVPFMDEPAVSWATALIPGRDMAALDEDGYFG